jgi:hypothetical protein
VKNSYEIRGEVSAVFLKRKDGTVYQTLIDTEDLVGLEIFPNTWFAAFSRKTNSYYVKGKLDKKTVLLHRFILGEPAGLEVDHKNHKTLDNRKINLRVVTCFENKQNRIGAMKNNKSSGIRGVTWDKERGKWKVQLQVNDNRINIGRFENLDEAEKEAIKARKKYMPFSNEAV